MTIVDEIAVSELAKLHPAQLALLLMKVQAAKEIRYNAPHPDYFNALATCLSREPRPGQSFARFTTAEVEREIERFKQTGRIPRGYEG